MFVVTRLRVPDGDGQAFARNVAALLEALSARPGFRDGHAGEAAEAPGLWALVTVWEGVGAYRRALSAAEVKITGAPVWVHAIDEPGVYGADPTSLPVPGRSATTVDRTTADRQPDGA